MKKYYYYVYNYGNGVGSCLAEYNGEFDVLESVLWLQDKLKEDYVVITNWKEISSEQFKKLSEYYGKSQK